MSGGIFVLAALVSLGAALILWAVLMLNDDE